MKKYKGLISNFAVQIILNALNILLIPIYIKFLGVESYGIIGIFAILQTWLTVLDSVISPTISREVSRYFGGENNLDYILKFIKTFETISIIICLLVIIIVSLFSNYMSINWIKSSILDRSVISHCFMIMGITTGLRFVENIYRNTLIGLQKQILLNNISFFVYTFRGFGIIFVLKYIKNDIFIFFLWQVIFSLILIFLLKNFLKKIIPISINSVPYFSKEIIISTSNFTKGMLTLTLVTIILNSIDKIFLSRYLSLTDFSYYNLVIVISGSLFAVASPLVQFFFPKFCQLISNESELIKEYHFASQLVTLIIGSLTVFVCFYTREILDFWLNDINLIDKIEKFVPIFTIGAYCSIITYIPFHLQLSKGITYINTKINFILIFMIIPSVIFFVPRYGTFAVGYIQLMLNLVNLFASLYLMHKTILKNEKLKFIFNDNIKPLIIVISIIFLVRNFFPYKYHVGLFNKIYHLFISYITIFLLFFVNTKSLTKKINFNFITKI